jgi:hypothetical protein
VFFVVVKMKTKTVAHKHQRLIMVRTVVNSDQLCHHVCALVLDIPSSTSPLSLLVENDATKV